MSIYTVTTAKTISGSTSASLVMSLTQNNQQSTYYGQNAGIRSKGVDNTFMGFSSGVNNINGVMNCEVGYFAGASNVTGNRNTLFGTLAGATIAVGNDNTYVGYRTGFEASGNGNVAMGSGTGTTIAGVQNVAIGFHTDANGTGSCNLAIGSCNCFSGTYNISLGNNNIVSNSNNILIGNNISNSGARSLVLNTGTLLSNITDDYTNLNNVFISSSCNVTVGNSTTQNILVNAASSVDIASSTVVITGDLIVTGNAIFKNVNVTPLLTQSNYQEILSNIYTLWGSQAPQGIFGNGTSSGSSGGSGSGNYTSSSGGTVVVSLSNWTPPWLSNPNYAPPWVSNTDYLAPWLCNAAQYVPPWYGNSNYIPPWINTAVAAATWWSASNYLPPWLGSNATYYKVPWSNLTTFAAPWAGSNYTTYTPPWSKDCNYVAPWVLAPSNFVAPWKGTSNYNAPWASNTHAIWSNYLPPWLNSTAYAIPWSNIATFAPPWYGISATKFNPPWLTSNYVAPWMSNAAAFVPPWMNTSNLIPPWSPGAGVNWSNYNPPWYGTGISNYTVPWANSNWYMPPWVNGTSYTPPWISSPITYAPPWLSSNYTIASNTFVPPWITNPNYYIPPWVSDPLNYVPPWLPPGPPGVSGPSNSCTYCQPWNVPGFFDERPITNELEGSLGVIGNVKVDGYVYSAMQITKGQQFKCGDTYWHIYMNECSNAASNQLVIGNSNPFLTLDNSTQKVIVGGDLQVSNNLVISSASNGTYWKEYIDSSSNLIFQSKLGSVVEFSEMFKAEVLNFTGKHRCKNGSRAIPRVGMIVYSTGKYADLDDNIEITIDEALPIVRITRRRFDARAFGVVGGYDTEGRFHIGNISFLRPVLSPRIIVQSQGEGGVWICNMGGILKNGDFITTSDIPGYGMRQASTIRHNYTIAKATCDALFRKTKTVWYKNRYYSIQFVGCMYCF